MVGGSGTGKSVLMRSIIGLQQPERRRDRGARREYDRPQRGRGQEHPPPLGHLVPERRLVLDADRGRECRGPDPRIFPLSEAAAARRDRVVQDRDERPAARRRAEISVRAVGRHAQARRAGAGAGARSRAVVPRRADRRPRPDRRGGVRRTDPLAAAAARADRVPDHPRSRHAAHHLRPGGGAGRPESRGGRNDCGIIVFGPSLDSRIFQRAARARGSRSATRKLPRPDGNAIQPCAGRRGRPRDARGAVAVHRLAGRPVEQEDALLRHLFRAGGRRPQQGLDGQLLRRAGRRRSSKISLLPDRPEFVWVRINVDDETPVLQGTTARDQGRRLHRRQRNPADRRGQGRPPDHPAGAAGLPGDPVERRAGSAPCSTARRN